jgi:hypothetical protein
VLCVSSESLCLARISLIIVTAILFLAMSFCGV